MEKVHQFSLKLVLSILVAAVVLVGAALNGNDDRPLAFVQKFKPSVGIQNAGPLERIEKRGTPLHSGDTLRTDENGFALVQFMDKSIAKVKPESRLIVEGEVEGKNNTSTRIGLEAGEIFLNVTQQGRDNFEVATNTTVASVKGTDFGARSDNYFWVEEGEVEISVSETNQSATLTSGTYGRVRDDGSIEKGELTEEELKERRKGYEQLNASMEPQIYKLRFIDSNGEERVIEVKVFENEN